MLFICYKKCSTCQKAQRYLDGRGFTYSLRDIQSEHPLRDELAAWHAASGLPLRRFFNTSGLQYRALGLKEKLPSMSEADMLDLLATDGMLVKRPLLIAGDKVLVGFNESEWDAAVPGCFKTHDETPE